MMFSSSTLDAIARALFGQPNEALSTRDQLRWGSQGSLCFSLTKGVWKDFESGEGGGVLDAVVRADFARTRGEAARWLEREGWLESRRDQWPDPSANVRRNNRAERLANEAKSRRARTLWAGASAIGRTLAERYLHARAIDVPTDARLRFLAQCWNGEVRAELPALIAAVTPLDAPDDIQAIHRTWLAEPGRKADIETKKAALGPIKGCGVVLGAIADAVLIGEGIESALSAGAALALPAVAALGTSGMAGLIVPARMRRVVIAYDHDRSGAGEKAARSLAKRMWAEGREVNLYPPPSGFADWNDWAQFEAVEATHAR